MSQVQLCLFTGGPTAALKVGTWSQRVMRCAFLWLTFAFLTTVTNSVATCVALFDAFSLVLGWLSVSQHCSSVGCVPTFQDAEP